jgi:hypothetical protein
MPRIGVTVLTLIALAAVAFLAPAVTAADAPAHLMEHNRDGRPLGILASNRAHLNPAGNRIGADIILKCLGE